MSDKEKFLNGTSPIKQVVYAIEQYCEMTDKTDEYREWLIQQAEKVDRYEQALREIGTFNFGSYKYTRLEMLEKAQKALEVD